MQSLGSLLQAAQMNLARAQAHHDKAVAEARKEAEALFSTKANMLGKTIAGYGEELRVAQQGLEHAAAASKATVAAVEAALGNLSWAGEEVQEKDALSAKAEVAASEARKLGRRRGHLVHDAQTEIETMLADEAEGLSRKVGDLSEVADKAKASLEAVVGEAPAAAGAAANSTGNVSGVGNATAASRVAAMRAEKKSLEALVAETRERVSGAEKRMGEAMHNATEETAASAKAIAARVDAAQRDETKSLRRGAPSLPAPAKSH